MLLAQMFVAILQATAGEPTPVAPPTQADGQVSASATENVPTERNQVVCRTDSETGSRVRRVRVCRSTNQVDQVQRAWREMVETSGRSSHAADVGGNAAGGN